MTPSKFLDAVSKDAVESMKATGIPASFTIAQAALESGWGASTLAVIGCNLFGVKADKSWTGATIPMQTKEFQGGKWIMVPALWRKYATWKECFDDHGAFLKKNGRYSQAFQCTSSDEFCDAIAKAGYATDPGYAGKIKSIMARYGLTKFDKGN